MGFSKVENSLPLPLPLATPGINPWGSLYPCYSLAETREQAVMAHKAAMQKMAERIRGRPPLFKEGDLVLIEGTNISTTHPTAKLRPHRFGPFTIAEALGPVTFHIAIPEKWGIHPVFHADVLTRYKETDATAPTSKTHHQTSWMVKKSTKSTRF